MMTYYWRCRYQRHAAEDGCRRTDVLTRYSRTTMKMMMMMMVKILQ